MTADEIKSLPVWGSQNGLLSLSELRLLMQTAQEQPPELERWLEIGHYHGLSTCGLVHALRQRGSSWYLSSVDDHMGDEWVPKSDIGQCERNRKMFFPCEHLEMRHESSQRYKTALKVDALFYDGDHGPEQQRFIELAMESPQVQLIVFDDRDFPVPASCHALLEADGGWTDLSHELVRGRKDKRSPETMTLAIWRRKA